MRLRRGHILLPLILLLALACNRDKPTISREDMAKIYADMLLTDQWLEFHDEYRRDTDTLLVYAPIYAKYGYTAEDFSQSMAYYLRDPDRYLRMLKATEDQLHQRYDVVKEHVMWKKWIGEVMNGVDKHFTAVQPRFARPVLSADSLGVFSPDTLLWQQIFRSRYDTLRVYIAPLDTLSREMADSLEALEDDIRPAGRKEGENKIMIEEEDIW